MDRYNLGMDEKPLEVPRRCTFGWLIAGVLVGYLLWTPTIGHGWVIEEIMPLRGVWYGLVAGLWLDLLWNSLIVNYRWPTLRDLAVILAATLIIVGGSWLLEAVILEWGRRGLPDSRFFST